MKVTYQHGPVSFEKECENRKQAFEFISAISDAFPSEPCQCCVAAGKPGKNTSPSLRRGPTWEIMEMKCHDCTAALQIVCLDDGRMFPGRQEKDKSKKPNNGWVIYRGKGEAQTGSTEPENKEVIPF